MYRQFLIFLLCSISLSTQARTLYVDAASGDDSVSYADNDADAPWATIGRALWGSTSNNNRNAVQAAQVGDTVIVRAGTYTATQGSGERYLPIWNPENSGSDGDPIIIEAEGSVILRSNTGTQGEPLIGAYQRQHIVWDGFFIDEPSINTKADTGPVVVWDSAHVTLRHLTIRGDSSIDWVDNHNAIRIEDSDHVLVASNTIYDIRFANNPTRNYSAIMTYGSHNVTYEWNEIYDSDNGIFVKGSAPGHPRNTDITVRFNLFRDLNSDGVALGVVNGVAVQQNIFRDSQFGVSTIGYSSDTPANAEIFNNTFHNISGSAFFVKPDQAGYSNISFYDNIVAASNNAVQVDFSDLGELAFSYNLYYNNSNQALVNYTGYAPGEWITDFNNDATGSTFDLDPMFSDEATNDFSLHPASPALTASTHGNELGATGFDPSDTGADASPTLADPVDPSGNSDSGGSGGCFFCW